MSAFTGLEPLPWARPLGWLVLHSLWQGALIAGLAAALLAALGRRDARARYAVLCGAMLATAAAPLVTWLILPAPAAADAGPPVSSAAAGGTGALEPWLAPAAWLWLAGALCFQARLALQLRRARELRRVGVRPAPPGVRALARELAGALSLRTRVRVLLSERVDVPAVVGWLAPVVLLPPCALSGLSPTELRAVLAHELAHVRRLDPLAALLQAVFEALFFFHPAAWWLSSRARVEREYCSDDLAVRSAADALGLARALTRLETLRGAGRAPALSSNGGPLMRRIRRLIASPERPPRGAAAPLVGALATLAGIAALGAGAWAMAPQARAPRGLSADSRPVVQTGRRLEPADVQARIERLRAEIAALELRLEELRERRAAVGVERRRTARGLGTGSGRDRRGLGTSGGRARRLEPQPPATPVEPRPELAPEPPRPRFPRRVEPPTGVRPPRAAEPVAPEPPPGAAGGRGRARLRGRAPHATPDAPDGPDGPDSPWPRLRRRTGEPATPDAPGRRGRPGRRGPRREAQPGTPWTPDAGGGSGGATGRRAAPRARRRSGVGGDGGGAGRAEAVPRREAPAPPRAPRAAPETPPAPDAPWPAPPARRRRPSPESGGAPTPVPETPTTATSAR